MIHCLLSFKPVSTGFMFIELKAKGHIYNGRKKKVIFTDTWQNAL